VIDRLRILWNRPLSDAERRRLFAVAAAAILATAGLLALVHEPRPQADRPSRPHAAAPASPAAATTASPAATDAPVFRAPSEEGEPPEDLEGSPAAVAAAKRAARTFLAGYLPYSYGRLSARRIPAATPQLRRHLAANRPRVPARDRHRQPRLVLVQSNGVGRARADLVALVRDGNLRYTVALELSRRRHGWTVTAVGS
jgi:hypothetical protein